MSDPQCLGRRAGGCSRELFCSLCHCPPACLLLPPSSAIHTAWPQRRLTTLYTHSSPLKRSTGTERVATRHKHRPQSPARERGKKQRGREKHQAPSSRTHDYSAQPPGQCRNTAPASPVLRLQAQQRQFPGRREGSGNLPLPRPLTPWEHTFTQQPVRTHTHQHASRSYHLLLILLILSRQRGGSCSWQCALTAAGSGVPLAVRGLSVIRPSRRRDLA